MKHEIRRFGLAIGLALLAGGWGMTRYAHEQQQQMPADVVWGGAALTLTSIEIFVAGVIVMACGAGIAGFCVPELRETSPGKSFLNHPIRRKERGGKPIPQKERSGRGELFALAAMITFLALAAVMYFV